MKNTIFKKSIVALIVWSLSFPAFAESLNSKSYLRDPELRGVTEYFYNRTGNEVLKPVRILGGVEFPGIYHIPTGTDLPTLITIAGGVSSEADTKQLHLTRTGNPTKVINLYSYIGNHNDITMNAGDIVFIPRREGMITPETATTITVIVSVISLGLTAYVVSRDR